MFRQEKLTMRNSGIAKMVGTVVGIGGAMLFIFYRGPVFTFWATHIDLLQQYHSTRSVSSSSHMSNPALGLLAGFGSSLCFSLWLVMQVILHSSSAATNEAHDLLNTLLYSVLPVCSGNDRSHRFQFDTGEDE